MVYMSRGDICERLPHARPRSDPASAAGGVRRDDRSVRRDGRAALDGPVDFDLPARAGVAGEVLRMAARLGLEPSVGPQAIGVQASAHAPIRRAATDPFP